MLAPHVPPQGDVDVRSLALLVVATAQALAVMHRAGTPIDDVRATAAHAMRALDILAPDDRQRP